MLKRTSLLPARRASANTCASVGMYTRPCVSGRGKAVAVIAAGLDVADVVVVAGPPASARVRRGWRASEPAAVGSAGDVGIEARVVAHDDDVALVIVGPVPACRRQRQCRGEGGQAFSGTRPRAPRRPSRSKADANRGVSSMAVVASRRAAWCKSIRRDGPRDRKRTRIEGGATWQLRQAGERRGETAEAFAAVRLC